MFDLIFFFFYFCQYNQLCLFSCVWYYSNWRPTQNWDNGDEIGQELHKALHIIATESYNTFAREVINIHIL